MHTEKNIRKILLMKPSKRARALTSLSRLTSVLQHRVGKLSKMGRPFSGYHLGDLSESQVQSILTHGILSRRELVRRGMLRFDSSVSEGRIGHLDAVNRILEETKPKEIPFSRSSSVFLDASVPRFNVLPDTVRVFKVRLLGSGFVGEGSFIDRAIELLNKQGTNDDSLRRVREFASRYWRSIIPLSDFFLHFSPAKQQDQTGAVTYWYRNRSAPNSLPRTFSYPEIIVPKRKIRPEHLELLK